MREVDYAVIGSGFGGSVSALRLSEKGYSVAVLEQGQRVGPQRMERASKSQRKFLWLPQLGFTGYFVQTFFKNMVIVGGAAVGGGSIVYAAVLLRPKTPFFKDPIWSDLGVDWEKELAPHYHMAEHMLGVTRNPCLDRMDDYLKETARLMGAQDTFGPVKNGIFFGEAKKTVPDPFFNGLGPERTGCEFCGQCLAGCHKNAKNSLDKNYLYLAEKLGARILESHKVFNIIPNKSQGGYTILSREPGPGGKKHPPLYAKNVILSAGVVGTLDLLFACRDKTRSLPLVSRQLGRVVRTNSEAIVASLSKNPDIDLTLGTAISSDFYPDEHTHITQNRFPDAYGFMKTYLGPLVDGENPKQRAKDTLLAFLRRPSRALASWRAKNWRKRLSVLTVMQHQDNKLQIKYKKGLLGSRLVSQPDEGKSAPTYLEVANRAARAFAQASNGVAMNVLTESVGNLASTAHILGGCHMGTGPEDGVIDTNHQVFGYPGLYVADGAAVSANVGVNPSLTIAALAERAMEQIPKKNGE